MKFPFLLALASLGSFTIASPNAVATPARTPLQDEPGEPVEEVLAPDVRATVAGAIAEPAEAVRAAAEHVFDASIAHHGDVALLRAHLDEIIERDGTRNARRLRGFVDWRFGDLDQALASFTRLSEEESDLDARLARARLLDATGRSQKALEAYGNIVDAEAFDLDEELRARLRLRMALMSMEIGGEEAKDALADFAKEPERSIELRNRCATVLALLGRPADAANLYVVPEPPAADLAPSERKKGLKASANGELRVAEWALRAEDYPRAQDAAWRAVHLATVTREIRYGLTLLAEAHRGDETLGSLLERFSEERETLPKEARRAWIELLRETGSTDEAIAMSQGGAAGVFTPEERRRLLEMYREADRTAEMVATFRDWIEAEPQELVWRKGLSRHFLEEGDREAAKEVWASWFDVAGTGGDDVARALDAADELESLGLDDLAIRAAERAIENGESAEAAFLFLYDLHRDRGRLDEARAALERLDAFADAGSAARMPLSDCFERLGDLDRAVDVLEGVRAARGPGKAGEDLEMRLAWLYSEVGDEEKALELWKDLWTRVNSIARRRFVEDRLMTVASRLGVLADIAVELEKKLYEGRADQRDSGLLVRLYTKVGDAVSAAEIVDEFLRRSGGTELEALTEKARIYLACNDYYHYEKAVAQLVEIDPEGRPDYYRQLAMSQLERGKPDQARDTLLRLQDLPGGDDTSAEFEAGVLALSGMRDEAISAYRRGLAAHPERIDSYLLMANLMKEVRRADRAVGMFQHLAETAERDDLFTIAIDGLLNMLVDAPPRPKMTQWARRITLERLAATEDRPYLYQLLADLAEETGDGDGQVAALENSLAAAGPRRASVLRELMELSKPARGGFGTQAREGDRGQQLAFGRRLVGLGELVPPDVYLDLGDAFLEEGDEDSAARTFDLTREFPDGEVYQQLAAERFEKAGATERALERYQAVLAASPSDIPLLAKVGELREALGDDEEAHALYRRAYDLLLSRKPLYEGKSDDADAPRFARNVDDFDQSIERVFQGLVATLATDEAVLEFLRGERAAFEDDLDEALRLADTGEGDERSFARHPKLSERAKIVRRLSFASGHAGEAEALDGTAIAAFPGDEALFDAALGDRVQWGRFAAARELVESSDLEEEPRERLLARLGQGSAELESGSSRIPFDTAVSSVLPTVASGDIEAVRALVRRADLTSVEKAELGRMAVLFAGARFANDRQLMLGIGREWLRLELQNGGYPYQVERRIESILGVLDSETGVALARYFVSRVLEDPEKNSQFVTILPKLTQRFDANVVDVEEVRTLLDGFGDRYAWGLGPVLALLPAEDRASALRGVWSKLEAANRARFLVDLVTASTEDMPQGLTGFIVESFPDALAESDDFIEYSLGQLLDVEHSHELCAKLAEHVIDVRPQLEHVEAARLVHEHALVEESESVGGRDDLVEGAAELWVTLALDEENDYQKTRARRKLVEVFGDDTIDPFVSALEAKIESDGGSPELTLARVDLLLGAERTDGVAEILDEALEDEPENTDLLSRKRRFELARGARIRAAETLDRLAEAEEDDNAKKRHLRSLVREWKRLHAPERALAAREKLGDDEQSESSIPGFPAGLVLPPGAMIVINGQVVSADQLNDQKKGLPKTFEAVREQLGEGDEEEAALIFRRLWRQFPAGQPAPQRYYTPRTYRNLTLANLTWPVDEEEEDEGEDGEEGDDEPSMGGFLSYEPDEPEDPPEPPNAYERIASSDALVEEQRRFLRTVRAFELDRLQGLLEGLVRVRIEEAGGGDEGERAVLDALLEKADEGETGRADQISLLAMLDATPERVTGAAADALAALVRTMPPRDAAQVRRLARVLLQSGEEDVALRLYRWCALLATSSGSFGLAAEEELDVVTTVTDRELVKEARDYLEGDAKLTLIQVVLDSAKPVDSPWQRENYETLVLDTWDDIVGPEEALERAGTIAEDAIDTQTGLRRRVARRAAPIFLRAGERAKALRALEVGVARLDPDTVASPEERFYREDPTRPGVIGTNEWRRLFPPAGEGIPDAAAWFEQAADALEDWLDNDRVNEENTVQTLALLAIRLAEVERADAGRELARRLAARRGDSRVLRPATALWVIDALRASGDVARADSWERELLVEGRLHPERVPVVVTRIIDEEGIEAAREAASRVLETMRHEELLARLIAAAEAAGDVAAADDLREKSEAAKAARERLEEFDS